MNLGDIIDMFENITNDVPEGGQPQEIFLANSVKNEIEAGRDWFFNRSFDNSQVWTPGDNYLTMHNLQSDFLKPRTLFLNGDISPYVQIPFELRERFKDIYKRYYIDYKNKKYAICGTGPGARPIDFYYGAASPDLVSLSDMPAWPTPFHALIPFKMAERWGATSDADDINFRMSQQQLRTANDILKQMIQWDASLKVAEYNAKNERRSDLSSYPDVIGTDYIY